MTFPDRTGFVGFEVVRSDADQEWHGRVRIGRHIVWHTEQHTRSTGVERAIASLARVLGHEGVTFRWNVPGREKVAVDDWGVLVGMVRWVDEREGRR